MMVKKWKKLLSHITVHWWRIFNYEMGNIWSTGWSKSLCAPDDCTVIIRRTEIFWSLCISWHGKARCGKWNFVTGQPRHQLSCKHL